MSGYDSVEVETSGGKYLKIEAGKSVNIHVITKSDDMVVTQGHWTGTNYAPCFGKGCDHCKENIKLVTRFKINVLDRSDNQVKIFEFGPNIIIGIKEIAKSLKEDDQSVHDVDLRISRISENPVRYQVIPRKKAGDIPPDLILHNLKDTPKKRDVAGPVVDEESVPF